MRNLRQNFRWALRTMRKNPGFSAVVVLSLGLAIGINTAVFSVVNSFLLRPLPIEGLDRMVRLRENLAAPGEEPDHRSLWGPNYFLWKQHNQVFEGMAAANGLNLNLTGDGIPERLQATGVTWDFFPLLGIEPVLGRQFTAEEDRPGQNNVVLLGNGLWARRFGSDPQILGKAILLNGRPHTVVGVMQPKLRYPYNSDVWVPLANPNDTSASPDWGLYVVGRLKPGVTLQRAETEMAALVQRLEAEHPLPSPPKSAYVSALREELIQNLDRLFFILSAAALFLLLIACANSSNLLLAQSVNRGHEVAVRTALGATRPQLIAQYFTYTIVLALAGGLLGMLVTFWSIKPLVALSPIEQSISSFDVEPSLDLSTFGFTLALSLAVGLIFGLIPALRVSKGSLANFLKEGDRSRTLGAGGKRLLSSFVVAQVALALVLLVGAGLMARSFQKLFNADRGFRWENVLSFDVAFSTTKYPELRQKAAFIREAVQGVQNLPGVTAAAVTTTQPLFPGQQFAAFNVEGKPAQTEAGYHLTHTRTITPDYFKTMGIALLKGRTFTEADNETNLPVVIVSESFAEKHWPGQDPINRRVKRGLYDGERPWITVVGMVRTLAESGEEDDAESIVDAWYLPYSQTTMPDFSSVTFVVKTQSEPEGLTSSIRQFINGIDPEQPIFDIASMEDRLRERTAQERFSALLYGLMGTLGLVLAAIGIYGVLSFTVNQRMREMGIRSAMGAQPGQIKGMILRQAMGLTLAGLLFGAAASLYLTRFLSAQLHEVNARDPLTVGAALVSLGLIALLSSYLPARRAAHVDPVRALRYE
ncbi:MAG TPA: ABC transporter permease [Thermoanaerobaculia bacterium]|nr:ABC transporter permease [Thermoanaerobaculia bacterium]